MPCDVPPYMRMRVARIPTPLLFQLVSSPLAREKLGF